MDSLPTSFNCPCILTAFSVISIVFLLMIGVNFATLIIIKVGEVKELNVSGMNKPRFRKREKKSSDKPPLPRRDHVPQQQKNVEPPAEYLQEDISESIDQRLPPEVSGPNQASLPTVNSTVAILPVSNAVPANQFCLELYTSLSWIGQALLITSDYIRQTLGPTIMESAREYELSLWLGQQEDKHRIVLYQCDQSPTPWTQRCIRQADCILIVALASMDPTVGSFEEQLDSKAVNIKTELVLLHEEGGDKPRNTSHWLARSSFTRHHHIQCPLRIFSREHASRLADGATKPAQLLDRNIHSDFSRLARHLVGESVGLVLGGGGARGAAHLGLIQAIQEAGIPIDMVGGVSIGAFMGALWCMEKDTAQVTHKASSFFHEMTRKWLMCFDLTIPYTSWLKGCRFNYLIKGTFGEDSFIEDLWVPFFTITSDVTSSCMRLHSHGSVWRYIRASMSLSGYMPPLCDPIDGHLLLDGGYVNNLPADVMRSLGAKHILAIDVSSADVNNFNNYGDQLSGWRCLLNLFSFTNPQKLPKLSDIKSRLMYFCCVQQLEELKKSGICQHIRPPIDNYRTLQFESFHEIKDVGYNHGKKYFVGLQKTGRLERNDSQGRREPKTFTDLAEIVARMRGQSCPVNRIPDEETFESGSDLEYDNDEVSNVSDVYDDQDLVDHQNLR